VAGKNAQQVLPVLSLELSIKRLEVNDLNFEFVFLEHLGQDGSGEKGFELLN
jgi:hypothetical protein